VDIYDVTELWCKMEVCWFAGSLERWWCEEVFIENIIWEELDYKSNY
jgi:hypothetical protein